MFMRYLLPLLLLCCLLTAHPAARADEPETDELVTRFHRVEALTLGLPWFIRPQMGLAHPDMVSDEESPLFGAEGEEPVLPLGTVDELIELIQQHVDPVTWVIVEGAGVRSSGEHTLVATAPARVQEALAAYLASLEASILVPVAIDLRVRDLHGAAGYLPPAATTGGALTAAEFDALCAATSAGPSLAVTAMTGQQAVAYRGRQRSYVQDYDVQVAKSATISDPIIGVANFGLTAQVRACLGGERGVLSLVVQAALALPEGMREHTTEVNRTIELPRLQEAFVREELMVRPGVWYVAEGRHAGAGASASSRWLFLVRATPGIRAPGVDRKPVSFAPTRADAGRLQARWFDVSDLAVSPQHFVGEEINLVPSNFTPPEPPELAEPMPVMPTEGLVDLLRETVAPRSWNRDGAGIEARNGRLVVRNTGRTLDAIQKRLEALRDEFLQGVVCQVDLVDVPAALGQRLRSEANALLWSEGLVEEVLADEDVRVVDRLQVRSFAGSRNVLSAGRRVFYAQDFEVELAEDAVISNPVVQSVLVGTVADVHPAVTSSGNSVNVVVRISHSSLVEPMREAMTPHGPLDMPEIELLRVKTNVMVPFDRTAVVGAGGDGERETLLLITARRHPYGN